jgi:nitroreductase
MKSSLRDTVLVSRRRVPGRERFLRMLTAAEHLAHQIHEAPVWIVPCLQGKPPTRTAGSSIYPAVQNMLLAARALGLGATLTTLYLNFEREAEAALGLPPDWHSYALIPTGPDRLSDGAVRTPSARRAGRCRLRGSMGAALPRPRSMISRFSRTKFRSEPPTDPGSNA